MQLLLPSQRCLRRDISLRRISLADDRRFIVNFNHKINDKWHCCAKSIDIQFHTILSFMFHDLNLIILLHKIKLET